MDKMQKENALRRPSTSPPSREESRRLVKGGREGTGKIPFERAAEQGSKRLRPAPLQAPEWSRRFCRGKKSGTAEVCAFVSL